MTDRNQFAIRTKLKDVKGKDSVAKLRNKIDCRSSLSTLIRFLRGDPVSEHIWQDIEESLDRWENREWQT